MIAHGFDTDKERSEWVRRVRLDRNGALQLKEKWTPLSLDQGGWGKKNGVSLMFEPMERAVLSVWEDAELDAIGIAMQQWGGEGQFDGLRASQLRDWLSHTPPGVRRSTKDSMKHAPPRWRTWGIVEVAEMIFGGGPAMVEAFWFGDEPAFVLASAERITMLTKRNAQLEEQLAGAQKEATRARDAHRKSADRLTAKNTAVTDARHDERQKIKDEQKAWKDELTTKLRDQMDAAVEAKRQALEAEYGDTFEAQRKGLNVARARARDTEDELRKTASKLQRVERELEKMETEEETEEETEVEEDEEMTPCKLPFELVPRRNEDTGRFQAEADEVRALRWAQLARGVAQSTVAHNLADIFSLLGEDLPAVDPSTSKRMRTEVTLAGEAMAAWKFAACKRVLAFGWDESTKFGDGVFSCNAQVEHYDGTIEDICLRGLSILPSGGTSKALLEHIEQRIFAYSRKLLTRWMWDYEEEHGAGSWARAGGPDPENIGLHRLAEDTVLMTDTCNGARCTKRLLAETIMQTIKEQIGAAAWDAMSEEERNRKYKVFRGDCWQHLRNIMIDAMAAKGDEVVKAKLRDDLAEFSAYERVEPEGGCVIRSAFKQFSPGGEYAKGRGREFRAYRMKHHASALFVDFERSLGSRQDLKFDGCVPLFLNRMICLDYLRGYIKCPKSENVLDKSLYTLLRCNEVVALLRANSLWKYIFSEPFRWLSGKSTKLKGWSLYKMSWVLDLVEKGMEKIVADPTCALDLNFDIFGPVAVEVPEFKEWWAELLQRKVKAADGKTEYFYVQEVLRRARSPEAGTGEKQATPVTLEIIKAQAERCIEKLHDKRLALADKLESQGGVNSYTRNSDAHARTTGAHTTNDSVENKFAAADYFMRFFRGMSVVNVSGLVQQRTAHDFDRPLRIVSDRRKRKATAAAQDEAETLQAGFFWRLQQPMRHALMQMARRGADGARKAGRADKRAHDEEKLARREEALQRQLVLAVDRYAEALELYDQWATQGVRDQKQLAAALKGKSATEKIAELRRQIEMRTLGCGWTHFKVKWGFDPDEKEAITRGGGSCSTKFSRTRWHCVGRRSCRLQQHRRRCARVWRRHSAQRTLAL